VVTVMENPVIGARCLRGQQEGQGRAAYAGSGPAARDRYRVTGPADAQRLRDIYRHSGRYDVRVTPEIIEQAEQPRRSRLSPLPKARKPRSNRRVRRQRRLLDVPSQKDVIKTQASNLLSFLAVPTCMIQTSVEADRDLIRRFLF